MKKTRRESFRRVFFILNGHFALVQAIFTLFCTLCKFSTARSVTLSHRGGGCNLRDGALRVEYIRDNILQPGH